MLGHGHGTTHTVKTEPGNLVVRQMGRTAGSQSINKMTCRGTFTQELVLSVVGSQRTESFAGAPGPASAPIYFSAIFPRYKSGPEKGQCHPSGTPKATGAVANVLADAVLTAGS